MDVRTVVQFAAFTRVLTLVLQAVFNALIPDHAADAFSPPRVEEGGALDGVVEALLGGLSRWDAEHFLFIAERGYVFEHNHAFFPLLPLGLRATAGVLRPLAGWLSLRGRLLLAVAVLNSGLFVLSAAALYGLGRAVLRDRRLALLSSLLFCLTPANVFLAAGYSEALFSALTFAGLGALEGGAPLRASLLLSLATACRANGLANTGFLVYLPLRWGLAQAGGVCRGAGGLGRGLRLVGVGLRFLLTAAVGCVLVALPFAVFQLYGYRTFCTPSLLPEEVPPALLALARVKGYRVPDATQPPPPWCHARPPLLYSYIQDAYWDVGFLRYFQLRQTPNFLLALPVALLVAMAAWTYAAASPALCLRLGLWGERLMGGAGKPASGFLNPRVFVYVVHAGVLLAFGFFCMHVQVLTRFLASSSPVLYWFSAHLLLHHEPLLQEEQQQEQQQDELQEEQQQDELQEEQQQEQKQKEQGSSLHLPRVVWGGLSHNPVTHLLLQWRCCSTLSRWLLGYFTSYWLLGLALHCNFLPWT
ncbi:palmitoyltransferase ZDHHC18-A [Anguilla rostrata]|uniref:palmitoyltransferase ZDHHC18-A n=1 Tax=Anguilla rostrata TaxID=7938 RepID=UPI0030D5C874